MVISKAYVATLGLDEKLGAMDGTLVGTSVGGF